VGLNVISTVPESERPKRRLLCKNGHRFTKKNTMIAKGRNGKPCRQCKKCQRKAMKRWQREHRMVTVMMLARIERRLAALERTVNGVSEQWSREAR